MATIANIFNNFTGARTDAAETVDARVVSEACKLRPLPNEDVFFFTKKIDNSRVLRQADPTARARDWKLVGGAGIAAVVLIALLLPSAYGLMAGYQLSQLQQENQKLMTERARLEVEESSLVSTGRLKELADSQAFIDPAPEQTVYLNKADGSLALNRR
jgi:cell division protein FtsL